MRHLGAVVILALLPAVVAAGQTAPRTDKPQPTRHVTLAYALQLGAEWTTSVQTHVAGTVDKPLKTIASWPPEHVTLVVGRVIERLHRLVEVPDNVLATQELAELTRALMRALSLHTDIECVLVGDAARIQHILEGVAYNPERIDIVHAGEVIGLDDEPQEALRSKRDASLIAALQLVQRDRCAALVTAGNSAAAILAARRELQLLPGVRQVALASVYPRTVDHQGQDPLALLLDVGATVRCEPLELVQFAVMGTAYARVIFTTGESRMILLHGFIKKSQKTPQEDLELAKARLRLL
jgi:hypothetical protein